MLNFKVLTKFKGLRRNLKVFFFVSLRIIVTSKKQFRIT